MSWLSNVLRAVALLVTLTGAVAEETQPAGFVSLGPSEPVFEPVPALPGASIATLFGDPDEPGLYVMRYRIPAGQLVPPHYHDQDRHITVISGTWAFGKGISHRCEDTLPMPVGSYVFHPKGAVHFDGSCTDEPIEVQVIGRGPVATTRVNTR